MAPCLAVSSRVNGNHGKSNKKAAVVGQGEKKKENTVVLLCSVGMKNHTLGEKLAVICMEICHTNAHVLIMVSDLIHMQAWISQWLGFASQGLTLEESEDWLVLAENPHSLRSHLESCESYES